MSVKIFEFWFRLHTDGGVASGTQQCARNVRTPHRTLRCAALLRERGQLRGNGFPTLILMRSLSQCLSEGQADLQHEVARLTIWMEEHAQREMKNEIRDSME